MRRRFTGNISKTRLPKESRTIHMYGSIERGDGRDAKKWYRCWHCGFPCNDERDALGDSQTRSGEVHEDYSEAQNTVTQDGTTTYGHIVEREQLVSIYGGVSQVYAVTALDSAGDAVGIRHPIRVSESSRGCPFCHTLNWRGDY